jgi:hypothetical protein
MRILSFFALMLLMMGSAAAQGPSVDFKNQQIPPLVRDPKIDLHQSAVQARIVVDPQVAMRPSDDRCFYIRSYNFTHADGSAPELKDVTTCTPAKANAMRQTKKRPAMFVPLTW